MITSRASFRPVPARSGKRAPAPVAVFTLDELPQKLRHFAFIRDEEQHLFQTQPEVNQKAVALLGDLHDELKKTGYSGHRLERFLVRVLFCLFAEDTDIFEWNSFTRFVQRSRRDGTDLGPRLARLFQVLDQDLAARSSALDAEFAAFRYINGGLFAERLDIADMNAEHRAALLRCCQFDWSRISPGVFGSLFQGVMEPKERRAKGAHYTSEDNIRRLIDPLFLDDLKAELTKARAAGGPAHKIPSLRRLSDPATKRELTPLEVFHDKLASLRFLDPACGCGNFLVVAYRELRALELEVLRAHYGEQLPLGLDVGDLARVNVDQFYGIELEEFPALIAETALWLTDHQVNLTFSKAYGKLYTRIPLKKSPTIAAGKNALRINWADVLPPAQCSYVLGNPPFIGQTYQSAEQKSEQALILGDVEAVGVLDYVCNWYELAACYIRDTAIKCAFVSTNSITQGEQAGILWSHLFRKHGIKIHFGFRTFAWSNEASGKAAVHVVIVGFSVQAPTKTSIYEEKEDGTVAVASGTLPISPYLVAGSTAVVCSRSNPLGNVPKMSWGNKPTDGGHFLLEPAEKSALIADEPQSEKFIRRYIGGGDFINDIERYCLWLVNADPTTLRRCPRILERIEQVRAFRLRSSAASTRAYADKPTLFRQIAQPNTQYLAVPEVSSENRRYIPMAFLPSEVICSNTLQFVPDATTYHFGVLTSMMHMAWMRQVAGRLKSDYRYSNTLVYNNYPWPEPDSKQRAAIEKAAQAVLDARAPRLDSGASLADLYDQLTMPADLLKAHQALDHAVDKAYRATSFTSERERVEYLFQRYESLADPLAPTAKPAKKRQSKS